MLVGTVISIMAYSQVNINAVLIENIEALAEGENEGKLCYNTITTAESQYVLYCGTCTVIDGKPAFLTGTGYCK